MANTTNPHQTPENLVEKHQSVPALEVPLSNTQCHEDEMLSWLQYPLEDSFDKNYCSEELYLEAEKSRCDVHNAFSNLTLREATRTWGVHDTKKVGKFLAADVAMAMGAQRAAGLLSQSGVDTFNTVRTNAQRRVYKSADNRTTEETSGSSLNILNDQNLETLFRGVTHPNFRLFSRAGAVAGTSSEEAAQEAKLSFMKHSGAECSALCNNQMGRAATCLMSATEQPKIASDTPMTTDKDLSSLCVLQAKASAGPRMGFSWSLANHNVRLGTSNEILKESYISAGTKTTAPPSVSSKSKAEAVCLTMDNAAVLTTQQRRSGLLTLSASAPPSAASEALAGLSGKRIRAEEETKLHLLSQGDPSIATASTVVTDVDACRQSKLARCESLPLHNSVISQVSAGSLDLNSKGVDAHLLGTVSGITTLDSQLHERVKRGDISLASLATALGARADKSLKEAAIYRTKRKVLPSDDSEIQCKRRESVTRTDEQENRNSSCRHRRF